MKKLTLTYVAIFLSVASLQTSALMAKEIVERNYFRPNTEEKPLALLSKDLESKESSTEGTEKEEPKHVTMGDRVQSHADYVKHQEARVSRHAAEETSEEAMMPKNLTAIESEEEDQELQAKKIYYTSHEGAFHRAVCVTYNGDQLTLEDGSVWSVASWDRWKTNDWLSSDTIMVSQNKWYFSSYQFMLINQNTGKEVEVNMLLGPLYAGYYTYWITGIDHFSNKVYLNDGSIWQMDAFDYAIIDQWLLNDTVIIGVNETANYFNPNILINVNMLNYSCGTSLN